MFANFKKNTKTFSIIEGKTERFLSYILIPLWVLTFYFFSFSKFLPEGINQVFVDRSGKYTLLLTSILSLVFMFIIVLGKKKISFPLKSEEKFSVVK